jgi:hypothetical protein
MAAAAVMVTSQSSLLGGDTAVNEIDRAPAVMFGPSAPKSESNIQAEEHTISQDLGNNNRNEKQARHGSESSQSSTDKPIEFNDTTKKPPRMSSVDDYTMLPEGYTPKDEDVICSWARQNVSWICAGLLKTERKLFSCS